MGTLDVLISGIIAIVSAGVGGGTSWFFARRKYNSEVDNNLIKNMKESLDFYKTLADDNKQRLDEYADRNIKLEDRVEKMNIQILNLMTIICTDLSCQLRKSDYESVLNKNKNEK